jgi:hypothetical protein
MAEEDSDNERRCICHSCVANLSAAPMPAATPTVIQQPVDNHNHDDNATAEQEYLQATGVSVMQVYRRATTMDEQHDEYPSATTRVISNGDEKVEFDIPLLLSMLEGALSEGEVQAVQSRLDAFIHKKWILKKDTITTKHLLIKEIERRYELLCTCDDAVEVEASTGKPPKPSTSGNLTKLRRIMSNSADSDVRLVKSILAYPTEKIWLIGELDRTLNAIQRIREETEGGERGHSTSEHETHDETSRG